jgi:hypothetical protein
MKDDEKKSKSSKNKKIEEKNEYISKNKNVNR